MANNHIGDAEVSEVLPPVYTDFESAFVSDDYPYGRLKTQRKIWIETKTSKTQPDKQRIVTCTLNPKTGKWNKPKASTYDTICVLVVEEETGHVKTDAIHEYNIPEKSAFFLEKYGEALTDKQKDILTYYKAANFVQKELKISLYHDGRAAFYPALHKVLTEWGHADLIKKSGL